MSCVCVIQRIIITKRTFNHYQYFDKLFGQDGAHNMEDKRDEVTVLNTDIGQSRKLRSDIGQIIRLNI